METGVGRALEPLEIRGVGKQAPALKGVKGDPLRGGPVWNILDYMFPKGTTLPGGHWGDRAQPCGGHGHSDLFSIIPWCSEHRFRRGVLIYADPGTRRRAEKGEIKEKTVRPLRARTTPPLQPWGGWSISSLEEARSPERLAQNTTSPPNTHSETLLLTATGVLIAPQA